MNRENGQLQSVVASTLESRWTRRGLLAAVTLGPLASRFESGEWDSSLMRYERNFHHTTEMRRKELLGKGEFVPVDAQERVFSPSENALFAQQFVLQEDQLVSLHFQASPDKMVSAPVVFAEFGSLTYQVPILRTPHTYDQQIVLAGAEKGENFVTIKSTEASDDITSDSLQVMVTTPEGFTPIYQATLHTMGIIGMRSDNFSRYKAEDSSPEQKKIALTNDAAFFSEIEVLEHNTDPHLVLVEVWRGARSESPRDPQSLYYDTGRLYDYDPVVFITMDRDGTVFSVAYQTDTRKVHQVDQIKSSSLPLSYRSNQLKDICEFHEIQNVHMRGTGHGMIAPELGKAAVDGNHYKVDIVSSFVPPTRQLKSLTDESITPKEREIEIGRQTIGVRANLQRAILGFGGGTRQRFLEELDTNLNNQIATLPQIDL